MTDQQLKDVKERIQKLNGEEARAILSTIADIQGAFDPRVWGSWYPLFPHDEYTFKNGVMP